MKEDYIGALEALALPVDEDRLEAAHERALSAALASFDKSSFGVAGSPDLNVRSLTARWILEETASVIVGIIAGLRDRAVTRLCQKSRFKLITVNAEVS